MSGGLSSGRHIRVVSSLVTSLPGWLRLAYNTEYWLHAFIPTHILSSRACVPESLVVGVSTTYNFVTYYYTPSINIIIMQRNNLYQPLFILLLLSVLDTNAWVAVSRTVSTTTSCSILAPTINNACTTFPAARSSRTILQVSSTMDSTKDSINDDEEEDDLYEYIEYDTLQESDFSQSEWLMGTNFDKNPNEIEETWCRLAVDERGQNVAVWGQGSTGTWSFDSASQFLSISRESVIGKQIWAGVVDDYYYIQGTVRGWTFWQPASVLAQWQGKRLGVDEAEAGTAPWFEAKDDADGSEP